MADLNEQTLGVGDDDEQSPIDQSPNQNVDQSHQWETMARAWLSAFPEAKAVCINEVDSWIDTNRGFLPADLQLMPKSDLIDRLLSIQNYFRLPNQDEVGGRVPQSSSSLSSETFTKQFEITEASNIDYQNRFQRTDQWLPVYTWLESLDKDDPVKSKDIGDWLAQNPDIKEHLCSRHSRYHLMHYIKKCHMKILKRRGKLKGPLQYNFSSSPKGHGDMMTTTHPVTHAYNPSSSQRNDSGLYVAKRNEAVQKYGILLELEKILSPHFSKPQDVNN